MAMREPHLPHSHPHFPGSSLFELDSRIHAGLIEDALTAVVDVAHPDLVRRVLDVGAGTGSATFRLAGRYADAEVVALDANRSMTHRISARASQAGLARVTTVNRSVLESGLEPGSIDLVWASSVFHEFDNPAQELAALSRLIRSGGVLAVLEMDAPPRVLPAEYERVESRLRDLTNADAIPVDWTGQISAAGFEGVSKNTLSSDQVLAADCPGGDYARAELRRLAHHAAGGLNAAERMQLEQILDTAPGHEHLPQVHIRGTRTLWLARRL
ncbi:class I SAM-dependent methyltransferase [Microbacterium sp.]|uniref:class I SAM-dependent methyltransferase n=1 Tax=Microbacterium sp. TaxID=51671 RepID=UPI0028119CDC|nr:class I SAM-dependent methyltransferase [Microbacterium sp.]